MNAYALEITAHTGAEVTTLYYSTSPAVTSGTPVFLPRIIQPGNYSVQAFQNGTAYGKSEVGYGEIILDNNDGALDVLLNYGFDGRACILRTSADASASYPSAWTTVFTGTVEQAEMTWPTYNTSTIVLKLRDGMANLHVKLPLAIYAGDNALPAGLEGTADDLKGKVKPLLLGRVNNVQLQCVNTSRLIYAVSPPCGGLLDLVTSWDSIAAFDAVTDFFGTYFSGEVITSDLVTNWDSIAAFDAVTQFVTSEYRRGGISTTNIMVCDAGVPLYFEAVDADDTSMMNTAPQPGAFRVCPTLGYVRLGSPPSGDVTITAQDNGGSPVNSVGSIILSILRDYLRYPSGKYNSTELAAIDTAVPQDVGYFISQDTYADELIDALCASAGACYYFDASGTFRIFQVVDPATASAELAIPASIGNIALRQSMGLPKKAIRLKHSRNWLVQSSGLAGSVPTDRKAWLAQEYRETFVTNPATAAQHLLSDELECVTAFTAAADAEATRRLQIYSVRRDLLDCTIDTRLVDHTVYRIGQIVSLSLSGRFGYTTKNMMVTGIAADLLRQNATITLWG